MSEIVEQPKKRGRRSKAEIMAEKGPYVGDPVEDCFAEVKYPEAVVLFMREESRDWFTKNEAAASVLEEYLRLNRLGYVKTIDLAWGFQATFALSPAGDPWIKPRIPGKVKKHYPKEV